MKTIQETIGNNLKYYRYKSGLSQEKFYESLGLNPKYYASVERGEVNVTVEFLSQLAKILKIDIREFFNPDEARVISQKRIDSKE
jgi:transcriptional regulator with XRE-family HTH domain